MESPEAIRGEELAILMAGQNPGHDDMARVAYVMGEEIRRLRSVLVELRRLALDRDFTEMGALLDYEAPEEEQGRADQA